MKVRAIEDDEKAIAKLASKIIALRRHQAETLGEIKGMLQAEEIENEEGNHRPNSRGCKDSQKLPEDRA
jgi:hypothetical protein